MHKIKALKLKNFKFFYGDETIPFDRKNVLLYGENGSGKSSIYWALYTFLQSVFKNEDSEIQKYFLHIAQSPESIKNRYSKEGDDAFVEIEFEDDNKDLRTKKISNTTVNTRNDPFTESITLSSDLIDYKSIFNIYNFTNKDRVRLFSYIEKNLMPFVNLRTTLVTVEGEEVSKNLVDWWNYLKDGLNPYPNINGPGYWEFKALVDQFNTDFEFYLNSITQKANEYLTDSFKENIQIRFEYKNCTYNEKKENGGRNQKTLAPEIYLKAQILNLNLTEETREVERVHTFLNEARLSSIALAIRMAMLKEKLVKESPKVLVLDDLLLSLDMGNRESVLNIILDEYSEDYQIIFLTHDKIFFESVLSYIKTFHSNEKRKNGETDNAKLEHAFMERWQVLEMYEAYLSDGKVVPAITEHKSNIQKAHHYFTSRDNIDYQACGNNLRAALEEFFRTFLPNNYFRTDEGNPIAAQSLTLNPLLIKCIDYFNHLGFDISLLDRLNRYRERALNQTSHYNPSSNYFKRELQDTFEILIELKKYRNDVIIKHDSILQFSIESQSGKEYTYSFQPLDNINLYLESGSDKTSFYCDDDKRTYGIIGVSHQSKTNIKDIVTTRRSLQELYDETIDALGNRIGEACNRAPDIYDIIKSLEGKSLNELKTY
ncbi:MAG: ATP-binding protein [Reichenbachiella sp.]|uniref:AAA family ATPase n=1 Tax=Reichenbachiella sp. TaxID=2184521 RepID=UPI00326401A3